MQGFFRPPGASMARTLASGPGARGIQKQRGATKGTPDKPLPDSGDWSDKLSVGPKAQRQRLHQLDFTTPGSSPLWARSRS